MSKITVWSKPNCVQCKAVYRALDRVAGLTYTVKNLPDFPEKLQEFIDAGHTSAPVVEADGHETFAGFNPDAIKAITFEYGPATVA
jgi:glutaredoxin-like protein NrdH